MQQNAVKLCKPVDDVAVSILILGIQWRPVISITPSCWKWNRNRRPKKLGSSHYSECAVPVTHKEKKEEKKDVYKLLELLTELFLKFPGVDGRIILRWILKSWDGAWTGLIWLRIWTRGGS